jgi:hypothetical protein
VIRALLFAALLAGCAASAPPPPSIAITDTMGSPHIGEAAPDLTGTT